MISSIIFSIIGTHFIYNVIQTYLDRKEYSTNIIAGMLISQKEILNDFGETSIHIDDNYDLKFKITPVHKITGKKLSDEELDEMTDQVSRVMGEFIEIFKETMQEFLNKKYFIRHYMKRLTFQNPIKAYPDNIREYINECSELD